MAVRPEQVELVIDELVLEGFAGGQRDQIRVAVERELARLLVEQGVPPSLEQEKDVARLEAEEVGVSEGMGADTIGTRVARALYRGLGG